MDIPFSSSGALSRAHYGIFRKVETATSNQQADQALALEIKTTRERLSGRSLTLKECKECLVILLYCATTATPGFLPADTFEFGLTHALNLAAAGTAIEDRRIGYLFCAELMPVDHELRLMMINTIRKDLESGVIGRLCLALENLISTVNEDIVPAVRDILQNLLSHSHGSVRRRAIYALRALSVFDSQILAQNTDVVLRRLRDPEESVVTAALIASSGIPSSNPRFSNLRHLVNGLMSSVGPSTHQEPASTSLSVLQCVQTVGMSEENIPFALDLAKSASMARQPPLVLAVFRLLSQQTPSVIIAHEKKSDTSIVRHIQDFLTSHNPNDQYLYLACLLGLDPDIWAGTSPGHPIVLEAWEVEKILQFLDSPDALLRRMTMILVAKIDTGIVTAYLTRCLEALRPGFDLPTLNFFATRLLDVVEVLTGEDGGKYAEGVKDLLQRLSSNNVMDQPRILEAVVENVLVYIRASSHDFRLSCSTALLTYLVDSGTDTSPSFLVICSALAIEQIGVTSVSPNELLDAFCTTLQTSPPVVQDTSLLTILRLIAESDEAHAKLALEAVTQLEQRSGRHIRKRCKQVLELGSNPNLLRNRARAARSSLPDFLEALEHPVQQAIQADPPSLTDVASPTRSPKLRYAAYEAPVPMPRLRHKCSSSAHGNSRSNQSEIPSESGLDRQRAVSAVEDLNLSLAAVSLGFELNDADASSQVRGSEIPPYPKNPSRSDLISLESPFVSEVDGEEFSVSEEFEQKWNELGDSHSARGWGGVSVTVVLRRLQKLSDHRLKLLPGDIPPFIGELKVIMESRVTTQLSALLRLKESEDDSCLWRLRCEDDSVRTLVKDVLGDDG